MNTAAADAFFGVFGLKRVERPMRLDVVVPIEVTRGLNDRGHWRTKKARTDEEKKATYAALLTPSADALFHCLADPALGARVTFLRPFKPGHPLDDDNLAGSFKYPRDEVARFLGLDDASDRYCWRYVQCKATLPACDVPECSTGKKKRRAWTCSKCVALDAKKMHACCRIEIVPAADVDPMQTAVRVLRKVVADIADDMQCCAGYSDAEIANALAQADTLANFDPLELYNV